MADSQITTVGSLIDALDGTSAVAAGLDIAPPVVSNWRARGRIPSRWWPPFVAFAKRRGAKGVTLAQLAELHAPIETEIGR